jgi:hypothetical protein
LSGLRNAGFAFAATLASIALMPGGASANQDQLAIEIYLAKEAYVCGPNGYPPPRPCRVLTISEFDNEAGRKLELFRSGIVVPPGIIRWHHLELGRIREYQLLGPLDISSRMSALVVFRWNDRRHTRMSLRRANRPEQPFVVRLGSSRRTFYHLPLQYLEPSYQEEWILTTNLTTYRISFAQ